MVRDRDRDKSVWSVFGPFVRTFLHKITICIKILILLIFPYNLYIFFSSSLFIFCFFFIFFFFASARLNMKRILNGQKKDQEPKELLLPQFPQPTETFRPFAVYFLFSALLCQKFGHHFCLSPHFLFGCYKTFFLHFKWAWCPVGKSNWALPTLKILWQPFRIRCFEPKCVLSLCSVLNSR